jgi:hypothetical protein
VQTSSFGRNLRVTYVSHACLKIEGQHGTLLCDPWFLNEPVYDYALWKFPAAVIPPYKIIEGVDYIYITEPILFGWEKPAIRPQWGVTAFDDDWLF